MGGPLQASIEPTTHVTIGRPTSATTRGCSQVCALINVHEFALHRPECGPPPRARASPPIGAGGRFGWRPSQGSRGRPPSHLRTSRAEALATNNTREGCRVRHVPPLPLIRNLRISVCLSSLAPPTLCGARQHRRQGCPRCAASSFSSTGQAPNWQHPWPRVLP